MYRDSNPEEIMKICELYNISEITGSKRKRKKGKGNQKGQRKDQKGQDTRIKTTESQRDLLLSPTQFPITLKPDLLRYLTDRFDQPEVFCAEESPENDEEGPKSWEDLE